MDIMDQLLIIRFDYETKVALVTSQNSFFVKL